MSDRWTQPGPVICRSHNMLLTRNFHVSFHLPWFPTASLTNVPYTLHTSSSLATTFRTHCILPPALLHAQILPSYEVTYIPYQVPCYAINDYVPNNNFFILLRAIITQPPGKDFVVFKILSLGSW
jgi:hypothetical protein